MHRVSYLIIPMTIHFLAPMTMADIINVPGDQPTIQAGIDAAVDGDEVIVASGTYLENVDLTGKAITLRSIDPLDPATVDATIIDAGGSGRVVNCNSGETADTVLSGFTITGGSVGGSGAGMRNAGGASPTVTHCVFTGNTAGDSGGAMINNNNSHPSVSHCVFSENVADTGGGMSNALSSNPTVTNCTFIGNAVDSQGGGMYNMGAHPVVTNCTFTGNSADDAGGGMSNSGADPTVTNCAFSENTAGNGGGGMFNISDIGPTVTNCVFSGNASDNDGGAMLNITGSGATVTNCVFSGNAAGNVGGGMRNSGNGSLAVTNCVFSGNTAGNEGGGMHNSGDFSPIVTNCILWGDSPDEIVDISESTSTVTFSNVQGGFAGIGNIDAEPFFVDPDGADDIVGTLDDNLRLLTISSCIDVGDNDSIPADSADLDGDLDTDEPIPFDFDGASRISDGDLDDTAFVDMGAFELEEITEGFVLNLTQVTVHDAIAEAIADAVNGNELVASVAAFHNEPDIDFNSKSITLRSGSDINQEPGSLYVLADGASLESAAGSDMTINGELRVDTGDGADVAADQFIATATSELIVRLNASLSVTADAGTSLAGSTLLMPNAALDFSSDAANTGEMTLLGDAALVTGTVFSNSGAVIMSDAYLVAENIVNDAGGQFIGHGEWFTNVTNDGALTCIGDTTVVGDYTNGGTTTVQIGTLTIIGSLINDGTIIGDVQSTEGAEGGGAGAQPGDGLDIAGDYIAGPDAALIMPDPVWHLSVSGNYDVAITDHANYHMIDAELRLNGGIAPQNLERMSLDIGLDSEGLNPSLPGHFPLGTLRIGPGPVTVNIVDNHDNDGEGQDLCEATYVQHLIVDAGATLNTNGCPVYYVDATIDGAVDEPALLIQIEEPSMCIADLDSSGDVAFADLLILLAAWGDVDVDADFDGGGVGFSDLLVLLAAWGGCS